jgi:hypothetical protein
MRLLPAHNTDMFNNTPDKLGQGHKVPPADMSGLDMNKFDIGPAELGGEQMETPTDRSDDGPRIKMNDIASFDMRPSTKGWTSSRETVLQRQ